MIIRLSENRPVQSPLAGSCVGIELRLATERDSSRIMLSGGRLSPEARHQLASGGADRDGRMNDG